VTWHGGSPTSIDYSAFVQLRDAASHIVAEHESQPRNGSYPSSVWSTGEIVPDPHAFEIPPATAAGTYDIVAGLIDPAHGQRLSVVASPHRTSDGAVRIGSMRITDCH
jgi:hypothetical protein